MTNVTAILVTYNSAAVIGPALASLPVGTPAIVVDNASMDDSAAIAETGGATVLRLAENAGYGVANNAGTEAAATPYVILMNPDSRLRPGCLEALLTAAESEPEAALLVPTLVKADGGAFQKWSTSICAPAFRPRPDVGGVRDIAFASGAVVLARRDRLLTIGGFDPAIFLYFEDDDLSRRVLDRGWRILHVPAAVADHIGNTSTSPSLALTRMKHFHLAWSERHVRLKHGLPAFSRWRVAESAVKLMLARLRGDAGAQAKQRGLMEGTLAALRRAEAQDIRERVGTRP
jgi:GT2 family glycosyltransferase